ncbi:MAG: recombinase family protein [Actinomycetota bacterium]|nr:recombinase family protein [Actinomycetota bacterium]
MSPKKITRVAIYARLSVANEESVSIERQIESATQYAEARGWEVALVASDDGVSATKNKPEDREGWRKVLDSPLTFEAVVVWKVDRLARRVLDFLNADEALRGRRAGLVAVEDPIDMTTAQGRAFATMLAVFGEMEAAAISARVTAAQRHLVKEGRLRGGDLPWFLQKVENPTGAGYVARPIPERADAIRDAAEAILSGVSLSEIARRWTAQGLPRAGKGKRSKASWSISSLHSIFGNPALYGATVVGRVEHDPATGKEKRVPDVLRNPDRTHRIDPGRVILDRGTYDRVRAVLEGRRIGPRGPKPAPTLLGSVAICGSCGAELRSHRRSGKADYACQNRDCTAHAYAQTARLDEYVEAEFLRRFGALPVTVVETVEAGPDEATIANLQADLDDVRDALEDDDLDPGTFADLRARRKALRAQIDAILDAPAETVTREIETGETYTEAWKRSDIEERREHLRAALRYVAVGRGTVRGKAALARLGDRVSFGIDEEPDYLAGQVD